MKIPGSYTRIKAKCCDCQLHFVLCTWYPQRHNCSTLHCPECGQRSGQFVIYCEGVSGPIYEEVPGQAKLVQMPTQVPVPPQTPDHETPTVDHTYSDNPAGPLLQWLARIPAAQLVAIAMLGWALVPTNPYGYYILLRFVICGISAYLAYKAFKLNRVGWGWMLIAVAVLYNPIFRVHLNREIWSVVNVATIVTFVLSIWGLPSLLKQLDTSTT